MVLFFDPYYNYYASIPYYGPFAINLGSEGMTAMSVSPNKRYAAIAEKKAEKPTITIYDLTTQRRRKVLSTLDCTSQEFISLAFSPDSKYLISQLGAPDWTLAYWHWEKGRVMASIKSNGATNYHVHQVGRSPFNNLHQWV